MPKVKLEDLFPECTEYRIEFDQESETWRFQSYSVHLVAQLNGVKIRSWDSGSGGLHFEYPVHNGHDRVLRTRLVSSDLAIVTEIESRDDRGRPNQETYLNSLVIQRDDPILEFIYIE